MEKIAEGFGYSRPASKWRMRAWRRAKRFVGRFSDPIDTVSGALLAEGTLRGNQIYDLVDGLGLIE